MDMKRSMHRILTTHCGSLPRPKDLLDLMKAKANQEPYDPEAYDARVRRAVAETIRQQVQSGIDIPCDGEQGKLGFFAYEDAFRWWGGPRRRRGAGKS